MSVRYRIVSCPITPPFNQYDVFDEIDVLEFLLPSSISIAYHGDS